MHILLTAFGPFGPFVQNPSQQILELLRKRSAQWSFSAEYDWKVLEVDYADVDRFLTEVPQTYDLVVHLGVATNERQIRFEMTGQNLRSGPDIRGVGAESSVIEAGHTSISSSFPEDTLQEIINQYSGEVRISEDAGSYLCNYIYFKSMLTFTSKIPVLFIHVADVQSQPSAPDMGHQTEIIEKLILSYISRIQNI